ncbi:beta-N-acetylhexosaminidase [Microbacterium sp. CH12i]|uniref:family 20 glycosylhydrolase n=1 Tax=Microbacterium sp. CH12i TaxID=1479651 RepID=UPI000460D6AE|nr:family 20 glycosylhydrolase [Microbacterium sp. CH12i]KDA06448.1 beta-N-acetylhexosaminidase [Microbacterium sp. CH12i]
MVLPLVPLPTSVVESPGRFSLIAGARIIVANEIVDIETDAAASGLADMLEERTGLRIERVNNAAQAGDIVLRRTAESGEHYMLQIGDVTQIEGSAAGLFYGIQTLRQLLTSDGDRWTLPHVDIDDAPRFEFRGVMLDVARTFFDVSTVKAYIDRASSLKFNRLHLHLTDDQGWRLQIDSRLLLTERGSTTAVLGRPGGFYTKDDFREIVEYAATNHMVVVPEIDLPGHTHAIGLAYPEIVEAPVMNDELLKQSTALNQPLPVAGEPYQGWGVGHSIVKVRDEETWVFLRDVLTEVAELTAGPYLHIGGDEALGTPHADFDTFITRVTALTLGLGKTPIAWHEAGSAPGRRGHDRTVLGQHPSRGSQAEDARRFAERGGSVIMSPSNTAYLDQKYDAEFPLGLDWAALIDLETAYDWEPTQIIAGLSPDAILGIEAPLWSETLTSLADIDQLFFPRAAALAEVGWSKFERREWASFRERVGRLGAVWDAAGWGMHRPAEIDWSS